MGLEGETTKLSLVVVGARPAAELCLGLGPAELSRQDLLSPASLDAHGSASRLEAADAVLLDARSLEPGDRPRMVGATLARILERDAGLKVIVLVPAGEDESARAALGSGAWDVFAPGSAVSQGDLPARELATRIRAAAKLRRLQRPAATGAPSLEPSPQRPLEPQQMVGDSDAMRRVFTLIRRVATSEAPVLISGESGTGKQLTAEAIHERSGRSAGAWVPIHCAAIPDHQLEAELFGHEPGAFAGAVSTRPGRFEAAHGGTLFLDEVGELGLPEQARLMRFLEEGVVERVGDRTRRAVDVRVIAASHRDLLTEVDRGGFRRDLYYRLAVLHLPLPPLRERGEDALLIAEYALRRYAREAGKSLQGLSADACDAILAAPWPGNARELLNGVQRAVMLADGDPLTAHDLGFEAPDEDAPLLTLREARSQAEIDVLRTALRRCNGNKSLAARALGISRTQFYELARRHREQLAGDFATAATSR